ncbi:MAG: hypothetical protein FJW20_01320 [Acidimicrobiia bacterium]|nr:hypothetical protein [Acidimicrobiia bacterium]
MRFTYVVAYALVLAAIASPQVSEGLSCTARAGTVPTIRAEGVAELIGDALITCIGGMPSSFGEPIPQLNIQMFTSPGINLTTRIIADPFTEALLLIDEPRPENQKLGAPGDQLNGVGGDGINYLVPSSPDNMGQPVKNVFQGVANQPNGIVWQGLPVDPPGTTGRRIIRITNVRATPNAESGAVTVNILVNGSAILGSPLIVANARPSFSVVVKNAQTYNQCNLTNGGLPGTRPSSPSWTLSISENFASVFKPLSIAPATDSEPFPPPQPQSTPGQDLKTESGFYNPALDPDIGLAASGTRFFISHYNMPANAKIFIRERQAPTSSPTIKARRADSCAGSNRSRFITDADELVELMRGTRLDNTLCMDVTASDKNLIERLDVDFYIQIPATPPPAASLGSILVEAGYAPTSPVGQDRKEKGIAGAVFRSTLNVQARLHIAARINSCDPAITNQLFLFTPASVSSGNFEASSSTDIDVINYSISSAGASRPITVTPIVTPPPGSAANAATAGWLTVTPSQNSTPATLVVQTNPAGLAPGTYPGTIRIDSSGSPAIVNQIPLRLHVAGAGARFTSGSVVGAADFIGGTVSPGQAIVIFGSGYGPAELATAAIGADGRLATSLGGTRILFDGVPAPMIYAANGQAAAFTPFAVASRISTSVQIEYLGRLSPAVLLPVAPALPGLFTAASSGFGQASALNQDGAFNSTASPAAPGEVIVLYGSGAGQTNPPGVDGRVATAALPALVQQAALFIDGQPAELLYAGPAPGLSEGVLQINGRIPSTIRGPKNASVRVVIGEFRSQPGVTIAVR